MSSNPFNFPPPPPAPPLATLGLSAPEHTQAYMDIRGGRGHRGNQRYRGRGRGNSRGSRRGYQLNQHVGVSQPSTFDPGTYLVPGFPPVQQPQLHFNTCNTPGDLPFYNAYFSNKQSDVAQKHQWQAQYGANGYNIQPDAFASKSAASQGQPSLMGPPISIGYDSQTGGLQSQVCSDIGNANAKMHGGQLSDGESPYHIHNPNVWQFDGRNPMTPNSHHGRGRRGVIGDGFGRKQTSKPKTTVAPAVPSFGGPLPISQKPTGTGRETESGTKKRKRTRNQLGLTPKAEHHPSSEEEDDIDEESRLTSSVAGPAKGIQQYQINYKGHISTLQSFSDITAWVEERRKRFPTKARALEAAKSRRELDAKRDTALSRNLTQQKETKHHTGKQRQMPEAKRQRREKDDVIPDAATKAKRKIVRLRKELERQEKLIAKAESQSLGNSGGPRADDQETTTDQCQPSTPRGLSDGKGSVSDKVTEAAIDPPLGLGNIHDFARDNGQDMAEVADSGEKVLKGLGTNDDKIQDTQQTLNTVPDPLAPISQSPLNEDPKSPLPFATQLNTITDSGQEIGVASRQLEKVAEQRAASPKTIRMSDDFSLDAEDINSCSSLSSSDSDFECQDPEKASSRRTQPDRIAPPKHRRPSKICRYFLNNGRCKKGDACQYLHELPQRGKQGVMQAQKTNFAKRTDRVSLYQRLVDQEQEKERHNTLSAIVDLGDRGFLKKARAENTLLAVALPS